MDHRACAHPREVVFWVSGNLRLSGRKVPKLDRHEHPERAARTRSVVEASRHSRLAFASSTQVLHLLQLSGSACIPARKDLMTASAVSPVWTDTPLPHSGARPPSGHRLEGSTDQDRPARGRQARGWGDSRQLEYACADGVATDREGRLDAMKRRGDSSDTLTETSSGWMTAEEWLSRRQEERARAVAARGPETPATPQEILALRRRKSGPGVSHHPIALPRHHCSA